MILYHGRAEQILPRLQRRCVDLVLTDPPYGSTDLEWDKSAQINWLADVSYAASDAVFLSFGDLRFGMALMRVAPVKFRYELIFVKNTATRFLDANRRPLVNHEFVFVFGSTRYRRVDFPRRWATRDVGRIIRPSKPMGAHWNATLVRTAYDYSDHECPKSAFSVARLGNTHATVRKYHHPSRKPESLCSWLIQTYSDLHDTVLDCYAGSGTTLAAAKKLGRRAVGIESSEKYCAMIAQRLAEIIPQPRTATARPTRSTRSRGKLRSL